MDYSNIYIYTYVYIYIHISIQKTNTYIVILNILNYCSVCLVALMANMYFAEWNMTYKKYYCDMVIQTIWTCMNMIMDWYTRNITTLRLYNYNILQTNELMIQVKLTISKSHSNINDNQSNGFTARISQIIPKWGSETQRLQISKRVLLVGFKPCPNGRCLLLFPRNMVPFWLVHVMNFRIAIVLDDGPGKYNTWWISQHAGFREDSPKMVDFP